MKKTRAVKRRFVNYRNRIMISVLIRLFTWLPDRLYLKALYRFKIGHELDLNKPRTFTEILQWRKLYDRTPEYTRMVDKYEVKKYVAEIIGAQYIVPTIGVWDNPEEIEWDLLPDKYVLKTTHGGGGGGVLICKDNTLLDKNFAIKQLKVSMSSDIYKKYREWPYKNVKKRIIAEKYLQDPLDSDTEIYDYKFFCFNGEAKFLKVDFNRFSGHRANYYDLKWNLLDFGEIELPPDHSKVISKPAKLQEMIKLAEKLSTKIPFLRVDFYYVNDKIYFGELTFYPGSGFIPYVPKEWDKKIGDIFLSKNNVNLNCI